TVEPARRAFAQCLRVRSSEPQKNVKSTLSKASDRMGWTKVTSSPTCSSWPWACSSSRRLKVAAARVDSEMASLSSLPSKEAAPTMAILYTEVLYAKRQEWLSGSVDSMPGCGRW